MPLIFFMSLKQTTFLIMCLFIQTVTRNEITFKININIHIYLYVNISIAKMAKLASAACNRQYSNVCKHLYIETHTYVLSKNNTYVIFKKSLGAFSSHLDLVSIIYVPICNIYETPCFNFVRVSCSKVSLFYFQQIYFHLKRKRDRYMCIRFWETLSNKSCNKSKVDRMGWTALRVVLLKGLSKAWISAGLSEQPQSQLHGPGFFPPLELNPRILINSQFLFQF